MSTTLTIRMLGRDDSSVLNCVAPDVFDNTIDPRWTAEFLADPRHHMAVAMIGEQVVGMASAVHYVHPDKAPELWVNEVGVAPSHQGQGIGRQLLRALFARGRELGCSEAWLGTDEENTAARRLYAAVGGKEESMVYVTFRLAAEACAESCQASIGRTVTGEPLSAVHFKRCTTRWSKKCAAGRYIGSSRTSSSVSGRCWRHCRMGGRRSPAVGFQTTSPLRGVIPEPRRLAVIEESQHA